MSERSSTFSEFWYRIAGIEVYLRPGVHVTRQHFRGDKWYILNDPLNNQFFRLRPAAYEFVVRLRKGRTVEEVWKECLEDFPETAPGQEEVIQLLSQLSHANLLHSSALADADALFERHQARRKQELKGRLLSFMFPKFPLLDPDRMLQKTMPLVRPFIGMWGWVLWFAIVGMGIKVVLDNWSSFLDQGQAVLATSNLPLLYAGLVLIKIIHEFGHAYLCRYYGGEVHRMGVMLLIFTPIPYVDATSSWAIRKRKHRVLVGAGGMIIEIFFAGIAAMIWGATEAGPLHALCYNMIFVASISTILFNANPLLRFDGYYILSDLLDIPNLHERSKRQLVYLWERYVFGIEKARTQATSAKESVWLVIFGVLSGIYRIFISVVIILFVADHLLIVGIIMGGLLILTWTVVPVFKAVVYLATSPALHRQRVRAVLVSVVLTVVFVGAFFVVPMPSYFRANGVVHAAEFSNIYVEESGFVESIHVQNGSATEPGEALVNMKSPMLDLTIRTAEARLKEAEAYYADSLAYGGKDLQPLKHAIDSVKENLAYLEGQRHRLVLRSAQYGRYGGMDPSEDTGRWLSRGQPIGVVVNEDRFRFRAVIPQSEASRLFDDQIQYTELKLPGQAVHTLAISNLRVIPMEQEKLPSEALSVKAGGDVITSEDASQASEPFFMVIATIEKDGNVIMYHGASGKIRFRLQNEPLLRGFLRRCLQMLQRRYKF